MKLILKLNEYNNKKNNNNNKNDNLFSHLTKTGKSQISKNR